MPQVNARSRNYIILLPLLKTNQLFKLERYLKTSLAYGGHELKQHGQQILFSDARQQRSLAT